MKIKTNIIILFLIILISISVYYVHNFQGLIPALKSCSDPDGGINYYTLAVVQLVYYDGRTPTVQDYCTGDTLTEYYCGARVMHTDYNCAHGCSDGACIQCTQTETTETSCSDNIDNDCDGLKDLADPNCQCTPGTCSSLGKECEIWDDGCGGTLSCGTCNSPQICNSSGQCVFRSSETGYCENSLDDDNDGNTDCEDDDCNSVCCAACDVPCGLFGCDETECLTDRGKDLGFCDFYEGIIFNGCVPSVAKCEGVAIEDTDNEGLLDNEEEIIGTDPNKPDTDNDGLTDYQEVVGGTNATNADTDGDGLIDGKDPDVMTKNEVVTTLVDSCYNIDDEYFWLIGNDIISTENDCRKTIGDKELTCCPRGKTCEELGEGYGCIVTGTLRCSDYKTENKCLDYDANVAAYSIEELLEVNEGFCGSFEETIIECKCIWKEEKCIAEYKLFVQNPDNQEEMLPQETCSFDSEEGECQAGIKTISYIASTESSPTCQEPNQILASCNVPTEIPFVSVFGLSIGLVSILIIYIIINKKSL